MGAADDILQAQQTANAVQAAAQGNPSGFPQTGGTPPFVAAPQPDQDPQAATVLQQIMQAQQAASAMKQASQGNTSPMTTLAPPQAPNPGVINPSGFPQRDAPSTQDAMIGVIQSGGGGLANVQGPPQPQAQGPPRPQPILMSLIKGLINPQSAGVGSRSQAFEGFLGNFLGAMGQGFANEGHGPGAAMRGAGAAMGAPYQQAVNQWQMGQQAQAQQSQIGEQQARTGQIEAQTRLMQENVPITMPDGRQVLVPRSQAAGLLGGMQKGQYALQQAEINKRYTSIPNVGLFDREAIDPKTGRQGALVPGTGPNGVQVTPDLLQRVPLPGLDQFLGKTIPIDKFSQWMRGGAILEAPVQGAAGPALVNKLTGKTKTLGLGSPGIASVLAKAGVTPYDTVDANGNPTTISAAQAVRTGAPGIGRVNLMQAGGRQALVDDIHGGIGQLRDSAGVLDNQGSKLRIAAALAEPGLTLQTAVQSPILQGMSDAEQDYTIRLMSLREQALAMRTILGAGQGSEDLRKAILQTVPNAATPNSKYAVKQLNQFEAVLNRVEKGIPKVVRPAAATAQPNSAANNAKWGDPAQLPTQARTQLKEGETVTFGNKQTWTLQNGKPVRVQ